MKQLQSLCDKPWKNLVIGVVALGLSYAAASWGIDSGRLTAYFLAIVLAVVGVKHLIKAIKGSHGKQG